MESQDSRRKKKIMIATDHVMYYAPGKKEEREGRLSGSVASGLAHYSTIGCSITLQASVSVYGFKIESNWKRGPDVRIICSNSFFFVFRPIYF